MTFSDACLATLSGSRIRCRGWSVNVSLSWHAVFGWSVHWNDGSGEHTADHAHPHPNPLDVRRDDWEVVE